MVQWRRTAFWGIVWAFLALLLAQVFFAGLGIFESAAYWPWHRVFGYDVIWPVAFVLLIVGLLSRLPRRTLLLVVSAFGLTSALPFLPSTASTSGFLAALHPVVAFLLFGVSVILAIQTRPMLSSRWDEAV